MPTLFDEILASAKDAGSCAPNSFGGNYLGGYYLQQVPEEITLLVHYLHEHNATSFSNFLEIGSASGGFAKFLYDWLDIRAVHIIDDNKHPTHRMRRKLLADSLSEEFVGDSGSSQCRRTLKKWGKKFDFVNIDADHSYQSVRNDTFLASKHLVNNAIITFHDSVVIPDVRRWCDELKSGAMNDIEHVKDFVNTRDPKCGIALFQYRQ